jgi:hypothetical protein
MPISSTLAKGNREQTDRLRRLVKRLDAPRLAFRMPNGWTVAVTLAHIAMWDRQRLCLMQRWARGKEASGAYDGNVFNDALEPLLALIPPEKAAAMAIRTAEEIDALLERVPDAVVNAALARSDAPNLDRGEHRAHHLDRIEEELSRAGISLKEHGETREQEGEAMGSRKTRSPKHPGKRGRGFVANLSIRKGAAAVRGGSTDKVEAGSENVRRMK